MKRFFFYIFLCMLATVLTSASKSPDTGGQPIAIVIHGGAGAILKQNMTPEKEKAYNDELNKALDAGYAVLKNGGSSVDAVEAAINIMENSPLFNAGKGSVFNSEGQIEMDASIMDGKDLSAGAVAAVHTIKNPISAAIAVMRYSGHVMMVGEGAELFARKQGLPIMPPEYFRDEERYKQWQEQKRKEDSSGAVQPYHDWKYGTVGGVALDKHGNIAAGTSTGGIMMKKYGRVGDSPIIGAGTYADNNTCGVSCTGQGEYFIRGMASHSVSDLVMYKKMPVGKAGSEVLGRIKKMGGTGGMIIMDAKGRIAMLFNTEGMFRGYINEKGEKEVKMYGE